MTRVRSYLQAAAAAMALAAGGLGLPAGPGPSRDRPPRPGTGPKRTFADWLDGWGGPTGGSARRRPRFKGSRWAKRTRRGGNPARHS